MTAEAQQVFGPAQHRYSLLAFVFFATLASYNFHWYLTPEPVSEPQRAHWSHQHKNLHGLLSLLGLAGALVLSLPFVHHAGAIGVAALLTFLYTAPKIPHPLFRGLKRIAIGKTIYLAFVWTFVTTVIPFVFAEKEWTLKAFGFIAYRYFFIYAICILFDYRDRETDRKEGIRSLITYLPEKGISFLFYGCLVVSGIFLLYFHWDMDTWGEAIARLAILPLLAILYPVAKRNFSDYLYYLVLDGLMALPSVVVGLIHFVYF